MRKSVVIVTPAAAAANNGNWRTAARWKRMLSERYRVEVVQRWTADMGGDAMFALHGLRSSESIVAWARARGTGSLGVVMTGTDLYGFGPADRLVARSLELAARVVVLQEHAARDLPRRHRAKARVIFQSARALAAVEKPRTRLTAVMVGHLREEKSPRTLYAAARLLAGEADLFIDHIGGALDATLAREARQTAGDVPNYRWLGDLGHAETRRRIQRAHVLVHASRLEGGAHVVLEAVRSRTPVIASRVAGNVGMLGSDYRGYFPVGDARSLARLLVRARDGVVGRGDDFLAVLGRQCRARDRLFEPAAEAKALLRVAAELLAP